MTNEQMSLELIGGNIDLRNGLIMQWLPWIKQLVRKHSDGSEDSLHDAIEYLATHLHKYDGSSAISSWIKHGVRGGISAKRRKKHHTVGGDVYLFAGVNYETPAVILNRKWKFALARDALNTLKQPENLLIVQRYWTGLTLEELADVHSVSHQAISNRIKKMLKVMKRNIAKDRW